MGSLRRRYLAAKTPVYRLEADALVAALVHSTGSSAVARRIVAAIEFVPLLMRGGVLDQLRARGLRVTAAEGL